MDKQKIPAFALLLTLVSFGVFLDAPLIPWQEKFPCYVGPYPIALTLRRPAFYLNATEWMSTSYALFGFGVHIPPADPCPIGVRAYFAV